MLGRKGGKGGVVDNKNIITEPEKSPITPSSSLKLGKGLINKFNA